MEPTALLHRHAARLAAQLERGQDPSLSRSLAAFLEDNPDLALPCLEAFADHARKAGGESALADAYLFLLSALLDGLRYPLERRHDGAVALAAAFQQATVDLAGQGRLDDAGVIAVAACLRSARMEPGPALAALTCEALIAEAARQPMADLAAEAVLADLAAEYCGDPYLMWQAVAETTASLPAALRPVAVAAMAASERADVRRAAVPALLDPCPEVRRTAAAALVSGVEALGPVDLGRAALAASWLQGAERTAVMQIVAAARAHGVTPAWPVRPAAGLDLYGTAVDGSGALGLLALVPDGRRVRLVSVLGRIGVGVLEAAVGERVTRSKAVRLLEHAGREAPLAPVSRRFFDRGVADLLAAHTNWGSVPPVTLLQVADLLGAAWTPDAFDWRARAAALVAGAPETMANPAGVAQVVATSDVWAARSGVAASWLEDDAAVRALLPGSAGGSRHGFADRVLETVLEARRDRWAEMCVRAADWLLDVYQDDAPWAEFAILAQEIARGRPLAGIPLMRTVAVRTATSAEQALFPDLLAEFLNAPAPAADPLPPPRPIRKPQTGRLGRR